MENTDSLNNEIEQRSTFNVSHYPILMFYPNDNLLPHMTEILLFNILAKLGF